MNKETGLILDARFEEHDTGPGHPERPDRARVVRELIESSPELNELPRLPLEAAGDELLEAVHDREHIEHVERACAAGVRQLDSMDTTVCPVSAEIARLAAGSVAALCREVLVGRFRRGFAVVRPPGHHAERDLAMGFCLFNNVAVAARHLLDAHGLSRVLIIDWDVHHGNGTQHIFESDPRVFFFSLHQSPLYPGTGARNETGTGAGKGTTLNCPLPPGAGDDAFLSALRDEMVPAAKRFNPEFVLISAGFDAHRNDPLAQLEVTTDAYAEATRIVMELADSHAEGRLVSLLEGSYDLEALVESAEIHLRTLAGLPPA